MAAWQTLTRIFPVQGHECFLHDAGLMISLVPSSLGLWKLRFFLSSVVEDGRGRRFWKPKGLWDDV